MAAFKPEVGLDPDTPFDPRWLDQLRMSPMAAWPVWMTGSLFQHALLCREEVCCLPLLLQCQWVGPWWACPFSVFTIASCTVSSLDVSLSFRPSLSGGSLYLCALSYVLGCVYMCPPDLSAFYLHSPCCFLMGSHLVTHRVVVRPWFCSVLDFIVQ